MRCRMPATARFASSSAVASTSSSSGGFYSWLSGEQSTSSPSLDFPLPDLLEHMAFRSTRDRSHLRVVRDMKAISKPRLLGSRWGAPLLLWKLMSLKWLSFLLMFAELCFSGFGEAIFSACYSVVLANPLLAPECAISRLNSTLIKEFFAENYTAPWMVLAASGVEHDQLVSVEEPLLSDLPISILTKSPDLCTLEDKDAMTLTVTQMLLEGGGSFSAGGPGKGVYSRLHRRVLNEIPRVQQGVYFCGITPGEVNQVQLDRAVQSTNSAILMNLESRIVVSEDIDRQVQTHGEMKPVEH
ncbi:mitochondrial processing peptidase [Citrus sinensis]|uniref:Mitochondrial processing peptidase n=1 Tax=Citrus sinensis TaxID=2711 RepID=A0ACB8J9K5_CITSI|nr:mitochondrial processing peptidase [Citrus sinensis]